MDTPNFSELFHRTSKRNSLSQIPIPRDLSEWPDDWKTVYYKSYSRLPRIALQSESSSADFFDLVKNRASKRDFKRGLISLQELSIILQYSCGIQQGRRRAQPSGGARFPIEIYPIVFRAGEGLPAGAYHYSVKDHALEVLLPREFQDEEIDGLFSYPWVKNAFCGIVMTGVFSRSQNKYGERGYRYLLIEAGHIGQGLYLTTQALGIKCCALGGTRDTALEKLLDIDGITESIVYGCTIGK